MERMKIIRIWDIRGIRNKQWRGLTADHRGVIFIQDGDDCEAWYAPHPELARGFIEKEKWKHFCKYMFKVKMRTMSDPFFATYDCLRSSFGHLFDFPERMNHGL